MSRNFRWIFYGKRQREVLLGVLGSTAALGVGGWQARRPVLAESGSLVEAKSWNSTAAGDSRETPQSDRPEQDYSTRRQHIQGLQTPPPQTRGHSTFGSEGDVADGNVSAWEDATKRVAAACDTFVGWDIASLRTKITDVILPSWIRTLPSSLEKLHNELSLAPWSLGWEIWEEAHDPEINPEIVWDARVRISKELCADEQSFLRKRQAHTTKALAKYLGVPVSEVHPEDVPIIAVCGSGGGLRALVAGASSALSAQEAGLLDCVTYTAGVSGSCWLQTLYNSSIGQQDHARVIEHLKQRIGVHIAYPPAALGLLSQAPTNKFLLSGFVEKLRGVPDADFGLVDVYGLLLAARLLVPRGELNVSDDDLKISKQQFAIKDGAAPLPIYTAVRHEIPGDVKADLTASKAAWHNTKHYDWYQWFEWTPYEFFCEELECGIPTWAVGRKWDAGNTVWRENGLALPELRAPLMMGIWGSAFCATLSHYYKELRPLLKAAGLNKLDTLLAGKGDDLVKVHPIDPALIPNFALGLRDKLPDSCPESLHETPHLQLMDAGMSNNLPIYPLLRPGRDVDVIVTFDASADVKTDNWLKAVDGYVRQRGIKGWPMGAGWSPGPEERREMSKQAADAQAAQMRRIHDAFKALPFMDGGEEEDLGFCTVWVGDMEEREYMDEPLAHRIRSKEDERHLTSPHAGITLVYFPFLANDKVPGVDPMKSDFMSTWNFIYTPEEIDRVVALARANFEEGKEQTRRAIRAVWERKKMLRLKKNEEDEELLSEMMRRRANDADPWDHFSGS